MSGVTLGSASTVCNNAGGAVELTESGSRALKLQTDTPHLVSLGGGRLSTAVTLHPLPQGRITLGCGPGVDIMVQGTGVEPLHCHIENSSGIVTLYPLSDKLSIDGVPVMSPTRLSQGVMLTIGRSNYMRFNHPAEARLMKSVLPNARISMAPITFDVEDSEESKFVKKPPTIPRKGRDENDEFPPPSNIQMKVSKFEYLAAQNFKKSISPKVFSANLVTVNTPAKDVLGRAPPDLQDFAKNLPQPAVNYSDSTYNDKQNKTPDRQFFGRKSPQYVNVAVNETKSINNRVAIYENGCIPKHHNVYLNVNLDQQPKNELNNMNNKTAQAQKSININRVPSPLSTLSRGPKGVLSNINLPSPNFNRVNIPSPSFNRNPPPYYRSVTPSPVPNLNKLDHKSGSLNELSTGGGTCVVGGGLEDVAHRKNEAEIRRNQAYTDRVKEQEIEKAEQARLEEILSMCAEYERQVQCEKNKPVPNRIKTNGSLPRDKRQCLSPSPFGSTPSPSRTTPSPSSKESVFKFDAEARNCSYENVAVVPQSDGRFYYENVEIRAGDPPSSVSPYENVHVIHQNNSHYPHSPRTRIKTILTSPLKDACPVAENRSALNSERSKSKEMLENKEEVDRKPTPTKFILPIEDNADSLERKKNAEANRQRFEVLKREKQEIVAAMANVKRKMADIEMQEEELLRELEMERALIVGEHKSKVFELEDLECRKARLVQQAQQIERKMEDCQATQAQHQEDCKQKLQEAQENMNETERRLAQVSKGTPEYQDLFEEFLNAQDVLDNERKTFEDLEFHHLEEEADWLASREEIQREIVDLTKRSESINAQVNELDQQKIDTSRNNAQESKTLERQLIKHSRKLEELRNQLRHVESELRSISTQESDPEISSDSDSDKAKEAADVTLHMQNLSCSFIDTFPNKLGDEMCNMSQSFNEKMLQDKAVLEDGIGRRYPSQDDIDRISKVTSNAPMNIEDGRGSLGKKTIESLKEIERNRQLHLAQQGSHVIEEERRRLLALKQKAQHEVRAQWAQRQQDCTSVTSAGSDDVRNSVIGNDEQDQTRNAPVETDTSESDKMLRSETESPNKSPRPLSETSDISVEAGSTLNRRRTRPPLDKTRPLTRYLPIRSSELDLRQHIESAGHQVVLCPHVMINSFSCRGFLHKRGSKLNGWSRRWFVFDRNKRTLVYYADKSEKKVRGGAYFQAIEEVYLDHSNSVKSPNPHLTFIIKTHERYYYLMAPSPEAMRIWIDVVFTGAEGYQEFEHGT